MASRSPCDSRPVPLVYPSKSMSLPTKIRPMTPVGSSVPRSDRIATRVPCGGRPAVPGAARSSSGVAIDAQDASVEPYRLYSTGPYTSMKRDASGPVVPSPTWPRPAASAWARAPRAAVAASPAPRTATCSFVARTASTVRSRGETPGDHDRAAQRQAQLQGGQPPGVEQRRGHEHPLAGIQRDAGHDRGERSEPCRVAPAGTLRRAGRAGREHDHRPGAGRGLQLGRRCPVDQPARSSTWPAAAGAAGPPRACRAGRHRAPAASGTGRARRLRAACCRGRC